MTPRRLPWLLALLCALVVLRVLVPPRTQPLPALSEAMVRKALPVPMGAPELPTELVIAYQPRSDQDDHDVPGDAFAVRPPPAPAYIPPAVPVVSAKAKPVPAPVVSAVITEPPPPPVPYQVIGTWDDGNGLGVFLAGPNGTLLARQGVTLQSEFTVTAVTPRQVSLLHLASKREVRLPVPLVSSSSAQQP